MLIPTYPSLRPLERADKPLFDQAFLHAPPEISEYTFTNIYAWRNVYALRLSCLDDFIILSSQIEPARPRFYEPIGAGDKKRIIKTLMEEGNAVCVRLPESTARLFAGDRRFALEYDRDNSDYLFTVEDLVQLKGKKYDGKRNLIKKFKSTCRYAYSRLAQEEIQECLDFEERWCLIKGCDQVQGLSQERQAFREMVSGCAFLGLTAGGIRVDGKICALVLAEKLNPKTLVIHILKAHPEMAGLYQTVNQEFLAAEASGYVYVNMEQDLGVEGLRKSKSSYHPVAMVKKYTLRPAG
ncbi:MAG TPA: phosphatidylglycerol lysyltransferase domain-containing protein [Patescibacteria group bacterium]|nr:phosphatidylglycerol lysyltransferase domain-containing protein [Patescibacteria group bacterium]